MKNLTFGFLLDRILKNILITYFYYERIFVMRTINNILKIVPLPSPTFVVLVILLFVILAGSADRAAHNKYIEDMLSRSSSEIQSYYQDIHWYYHNEDDVDLIVNDENCSKLHFCYASENNETLDESCPTILFKYKEVGAIGQRRFLEKCTTLKINELKKMYLN